jgi:CheY-like chemotaxis protein
VVDDNPQVAESLARLLAIMGHQVHTAHDGAAALEAIRTFHPEVIFLDIGLPGMNGYEVAQHLRRQYHRNMRLVAITGYGQEEDKRRSHQAGFDHHLVKPIAKEALQEVLAMEVL